MCVATKAVTIGFGLYIFLMCALNFFISDVRNIMI